MDQQGVAKPNTENSTTIAKNVMHILMFSFLIEYQCSDHLISWTKIFAQMRFILIHPHNQNHSEIKTKL